MKQRLESFSLPTNHIQDNSNYVSRQSGSQMGFVQPNQQMYPSYQNEMHRYQPQQQSMYQQHHGQYHHGQYQQQQQQQQLWWNHQGSAQGAQGGSWNK